MRSKAPLALMEQMVMILVFALAAALCLQVFVFADQMSRRTAAIDRAVAECQNAAELLKASGGDMSHALTTVAREMGGTGSQGLVQIGYDKNWNVLPAEESEDFVYVVALQGMPTETDRLWKAQIWAAAVKDLQVGGDGSLLFQMEAAWQREVAPLG